MPRVSDFIVFSIGFCIVAGSDLRYEQTIHLLRSNDLTQELAAQGFNSGVGVRCSGFGASGSLGSSGFGCRVFAYYPQLFASMIPVEVYGQNKPIYGFGVERLHFHMGKSGAS